MAALARPSWSVVMTLAAGFVLAGCGGSPPQLPGDGGGGGGGGGSVEGLFLFLADDGVHGIEPWVTDGTPEGTHLLIDQVAGPDGSRAFLRYFDWFRLGSSLYYSGDDAIYRSDGTPAGTEAMIPDAAFTHVRHAGDRVLFNGTLPGDGHGMYLSDGTVAGTQRIGQGVPGWETAVMASVGGVVPGGTTTTFFSYWEGVLYATTTSEVNVLWTSPSDCSAFGAVGVGTSGVYFPAANASTTPSGDVLAERCRVWRYNALSGAGVEVHRDHATSASDSVRLSGYALHGHDGWLLYTLSRCSGCPRVLRATDETPWELLDPAEADTTDVQVSAEGLGQVIQLVQRTPGTATYVVGNVSSHGTARVLALLTGPHDDLEVTVVDDVGNMTFGAGGQHDWLGNRLVYLNRRSNAVMSLVDGSTNPQVLLPDGVGRRVWRLMADPYAERAFVWYESPTGPEDTDTGLVPTALELWVTDGTPAGTKPLGVFCEAVDDWCGSNLFQ